MDKPPIYTPSELNSPLRQGEILTNVIQYKPINLNLRGEDNENEIIVQPITHPYAIIVTQDCDLDWDYKARFKGDKIVDQTNPKLLNSIILCVIDTAQKIRDISDKNMMNSKEWGLVESHRHERFYFFSNIPSECELKQEGLPELTADLKKVFGVDADFLYQQINLNIVARRCYLNSPYLEHFAQRYHNFHGRVALPSDYESQKSG